MIDIAVRDLTKEYEVGQPVLDGLTFQVDAGERVGILGRNGAGKTTLFRILTGQERPDGGAVQIAPGKRLGLISQIPVYPAGSTVEDVLRTAFDELYAMERELHELTDRLAGADPALLARYDRLQAAFESGGGYETEMRLEKVCSGLGIERAFRDKLFADLSGGEKTRINLARLILTDTEILLLDEPTNHLDLHAVEWLEDYLSHYKGTVLAISHDRYFLDRTISRVIEIRGGKAAFYAGSYSFYAVEKEKRFLEQLRQYQKEQAKIEQLQKAADAIHLWAFMGSDKLHKRAFSIEKRIAKLDQTARPTKDRKLTARFGEAEFFADDLLTLRGVEKSFEGRTLFRDVDLRVEPGDRIALLGDNGTGKSTLLKLILGEEDQDAGKIKLGLTVKIGYLPQQIHFDHPERSLYDTMLYEAGCDAQQARDRLARFLFRGEDVFKPVSVLSGGEQSRLRLCMLMDEKVNLLILDEPTNHLDLDAREWIEGAVEDYEGTLLFVSHDRYFIDRFATRIWTLEDGHISDFRGDYTAYQAMRERQKALAPPPVREEKPKKEKPKRTGGTKQLRKDLAAAEKRMEKLDGLLAALGEEKEAAASDYQRLQELLEQEAAYAAEYDELMERWEALSEAIAAEEG